MDTLRNILLGATLALGISHPSHSSLTKGAWCRDLLLPTLYDEGSPTLTEPQLRAKGFGDEYVAGFDAISRQVKVATSLHLNGADARRTPIEYFEGIVDSHTDYVESGIRSWDASNERLRRLGRLYGVRQKVQEWRRQGGGGITYDRFLALNNYLAKLVDRDLHFRISLPPFHGGYEHLNNRHRTEASFISRFPSVIVAPLVEGHRLGMDTLTYAFTYGVYPAGLVNRNYKGFTPGMYYQHDLAHAENFEFFFKSLGLKVKLMEFNREFMKRRNDLSTEESRMAGLVYWGLVHEEPHHLVHVVEKYPYKTLSSIQIEALRKREREGEFPIPEHYDRSEYLHNSVELFNGLISDINDFGP